MIKVKAYIYFTLLIVLIQCESADPVPRAHGHYFISNKTDLSLHVSAFDKESGTELELLGSEISPMVISHFYTAPAEEYDLSSTPANYIVSSKGNYLSPERIFGDFIITTEINGKDSIVYSGVNNEDWEERKWIQLEGRHGPQLYLSIE